MFAALGDANRLRIVDALTQTDLMPSELGALTGLSSNLLAFHLDVLEDVGLVVRHRSQGDGRRRYVQLATPKAVPVATTTDFPSGPVLFVCTHNSARSQLAAALWTQRVGGEAASAGTDPAERVHPHAVAAGHRVGLDLSGASPRSYEDIQTVPAVVVSVCDRARESMPDFEVPGLHWSIPDPTRGGRRRDFDNALALLSDRIDRMVA